jgi:hypothetical protein
MKAIERDALQTELSRRSGQELYLHLETSTGAYATLNDEKAPTVAAFIRNVQICYERGTVAGVGPYRVGLKLPGGWVYADGLTDWHLDGQGRLLLAGHTDAGALLVALQLSPVPFST